MVWRWCPYPRELEDELIYFITRLRELRCPVYKDTVIDYAMRLISTHEASQVTSQHSGSTVQTASQHSGVEQ